MLLFDLIYWLASSRIGWQCRHISGQLANGERQIDGMRWNAKSMAVRIRDVCLRAKIHTYASKRFFSVLVADGSRSVHDRFAWCQIALVVIYFRLIYSTRKTASTEWLSHAFKVHSFHFNPLEWRLTGSHIHTCIGIGYSGAGRESWTRGREEPCGGKRMSPMRKNIVFYKFGEEKIWIRFHSIHFLQCFFFASALFLLEEERERKRELCAVAVFHSLSRSSFLIHFVCKLCELQSVRCVRNVENILMLSTACTSIMKCEGCRVKSAAAAAAVAVVLKVFPLRLPTQEGEKM